MKEVKKCVAFVLITALVLSFAAIGAFADTTDVKVEKNINLALHKNVHSSGGNTNAGLLTDGLYNTSAVSGTAAKDETFTVDLERLARITDIKLWPAQSSGSIAGDKMSNIALEVSCDGDAWTTLEVQETVSSSLTKDSVFSCELSEGEFYRYVRVKKTEAGDYEYGELEVFADVKAIEASRGKKVTATSESNIAPTAFTLESVVDGDTTAYGWLFEDDLHGEKCIAVDLGKEQAVDWIEMYTRRGTAVGAAYNRNWIAYGLGEGDEDYLLSPDGIGTQIFTSQATSGSQANFPANIEENDPNNHLFETLDGLSAYRYFSFRKTSLYVGIAEIGIFSIMPEVTGAEIEGTSVKVSFSEAMDTDTFSDIVVKINGAVANANIDALDDYTAVLELGNIYYGAKVDVVITESVKSARGFGAFASVETCYFPQALEVSGPVFINGTDEESTEITELSGNTAAGVKMTFKNNQPQISENVIMVAVLYDENHTIIRMDETKATLLPNSDEKTLIAGFDLPSDTTGHTLSVFVWKEYRFMSPWFAHKSIS